jgi:hypothetical protein
MIADIILLAHMYNHYMKQRLSWKADRFDSRDFPRFLKLKYLLPCSQDVTTGPHFEPLEASPCAPIPFLQDPL